MDRPGPSPQHEARGPLSAEEFAESFRASARLLWSVAVGVLGRTDAAEDVLQEAAVIALGKLDQFERGTHFAAWMGRIVRLVALNSGRRATRDRASELDALELLAADPAVLDPGIDERGQLSADRGQFDDALRKALEELAPTPRSCLLLRVLHGLDYARLAALLEIPEGTAMSHVHRARAFLRERLGGVEVGPASAGGAP